jgi:hypothetical protein
VCEYTFGIVVCGVSQKIYGTTKHVMSLFRSDNISRRQLDEVALCVVGLAEIKNSKVRMNAQFRQVRIIE